MLRKLVIFGLCAGTSASIPIVIERNPALRDYVVQKAVGGAEEDTGSDALLQVVKAPSPATGRRVMVEGDARGHFLAEFRINGRRVEGVIDTGASMVALNTSTARRMGITVGPADFRHEVQTANGTLKAAGAMIASMEIGRIAVRDVPVLILDDASLQTVLIGMSFLKTLSRFEVEDGTMLLVQ